MAYLLSTPTKLHLEFAGDDNRLHLIPFSSLEQQAHYCGIYHDIVELLPNIYTLFYKSNFHGLPAILGIIFPPAHTHRSRPRKAAAPLYPTVSRLPLALNPGIHAAGTRQQASAYSYIDRSTIRWTINPTAHVKTHAIIYIST